MSPGERDLAALRAKASPSLNADPVAIVSIRQGDVPEALRRHVIGTFREREGLTVYLNLAAAEAAGLTILLRAAWITLTVDSSLEAVGFTALFSQALAARGIAANVVAGAFHDHVFVPLDKTHEAMAALLAL